MPRKQRFKPSRKPKPPILVEAAPEPAREQPHPEIERRVAEEPPRSESQPQ